MSDRFDLRRDDDGHLLVVRWLGDPQLSGWRRDDLWKGTHDLTDYITYENFGLLYPALLGTIWRLTSGLSRWALPVFDGVWIARGQGRSYESVRWEYQIDWESTDWIERDHGFVPARSLNGGGNTDTSAMAALIPVPTWADLMSVIPIGDQANTLCLFATEPADRAARELISILQSDERPSVESLLRRESDVFAVVTQEDEGMGRSSVLIAGRARLRQSIASEAASLSDRVAQYLADTATVETSHEWGAALERLAAVRGVN